jgi:hypothetical protein
MSDTGSIDDQLIRLHDLNYEVSQRLALLSMLAIARITRSALPGAAYVSVGWSDQGPYLVPDGGYLTGDATLISEDSAFSEDTLDTAISPYCANLSEDNQGTWQAFSSAMPDEPYRLKIDDILEADPSIAAGHAGMHAGPAGHDLTPSGPPAPGDDHPHPGRPHPCCRD